MAMALVDVFGASLVAPAPFGRSCAMCACEARAEELAEWLISEGAAGRGRPWRPLGGSLVMVCDGNPDAP